MQGLAEFVFAAARGAWSGRVEGWRFVCAYMVDQELSGSEWKDWSRRSMSCFEWILSVAQLPV